MASNVGHFLLFLLLLALAVWAGSTQVQSLVLPVEDDAIFRTSDVYRCPSPNPLLYYRPVIGILSHPGDGASGTLNNATNVSNIPASYVKFVEAAGGRVIPIIYNEPRDIINKKLTLVNGVLFTGGRHTYDSQNQEYYKLAMHIFQTVLDKNNKKDHFPLYGMALGFELLIRFVSKETNILERIAAVNLASTLQFGTSDLSETVFQSFPEDLRAKMSTECVAMYVSRLGITPAKLQENSALSSFFNILTTSADASNKDFVSTAQALDYPIVGFQWVPPKNAFEWGDNTIPHTEDAVRVTQLTANYFISEARKSSTRVNDATQVLPYLIYNYQPTYSGRDGKGYDQVYIFE